ncbi:glycosyltransferase [bacterium]|nr:MAG: glycosyltransferase [bacterium]
MVIKECIESVLIQDCQEWELLISDDGSTDGSREYLDTLMDSRITLFKQDKNLGIFGNLNFLFKHAKASVSQILCQDDYFINTNSLNKIVRYWDTVSSEVGFVRFNHTESSQCHTINLQTKITPSLLTPNNSDIWFFVFGNIPGNLSNVSLRTHIITDVGGFNESLPFAGDFEFWVRAARKFLMGVEKDLVIYVRRHNNAASNYLSLKGELYPQHIFIYKSLIDNLSNNYDKRQLVKYFNLEVCSFHYRTAIKAALQGKLGYLKTFIEAKSPICWPKVMQMILCFPFAIFNGKQNYTVDLAKKLIAN